MGHPAGVTRDFKAMERRRLRAARLLEKGLAEAEVARRVGVHRQSVNRWHQQLLGEGRAALKYPGRAGRPPGLTEAQRVALQRELERGPEAQGYRTALWTLRRVAKLIEDEYGVRYSTGHVWRVLRDLGFSCQRPTGRALERDEAAIRRWKRDRWPTLKKTPPADAKRLSSSTKAD